MIIGPFLFDEVRLGFLTSGGVQVVTPEHGKPYHRAPALFVFKLTGLRVGRGYFGWIKRDLEDLSRTINERPVES